MIGGKNKFRTLDCPKKATQHPGQFRESPPPLQDWVCPSYCKRHLEHSFSKEVGIRVKQIKRPSGHVAEVDKRKRNSSSIGKQQQKVVHSCGEKFNLPGQKLGELQTFPTAPQPKATSTTIPSHVT